MLEKTKAMLRSFKSIKLCCRLLFVLACSGGLVWAQSSPSINSFSVTVNPVKEMGRSGAFVNASDADGDSLIYTWSFESDPTEKAVFYNPLVRGFRTVLSGPEWTAVTFGVGDVGNGPPGEGPTGVQGQTVTLRLEVSDGTASEPATGFKDVLVSGFNEKPVVILDPTGMGTENDPVLSPGGISVSGLGSFDPDGVEGIDFPWVWSIGTISGGAACPGTGGFTLFLGDSAVPVMTFPRVSNLDSDPMTVKLEYNFTEGLYLLTGSATGYIASENGCSSGGGGGGGNTPPNANPTSSTENAAFGDSVSLFGNFSDPDSGDTHTYSWTQIKTSGEPTVSPFNPTQQHTTIIAPDVAVTLTYRFEVTDLANASDSEDIQILVTEQGGGGGGGGGNSVGTVVGCNSGNEPAVATVPATYTVAEDVQGQISAANASDPDGTSGVLGPPGAYFLWSVLDGKELLSNGSLTGRSTNTVSFTAPPVNADTIFTLESFVQDAAGCGTKYPITLVVQDSTGNGDPNAVLTYEEEAQGISGAASSENVQVVSPATIELDASGSSDPDGNPITFSWQHNNADLSSGSTAFSSTGSTATLTALSATLGPVTVTVTVSDDRGGQDSKSQTFVFVESSDLAPTAVARVTKGGAEVSGPFANGEEFNLDGSASTPPEGVLIEDLVFEWTQTQGSVFTKDLDQMISQVRIADIEAEETLRFELRVRNGSASDVDDVEILVKPGSTNGGSQGSSEIIYPVWAAGPFQESIFQTTVIIDNLAEEPVEDVKIQFYDKEGTEVDLHHSDLDDPENPKPWDPDQPFTIGGFSSRVIEFVAPPGASGVLEGWAQATSTGLLSGSTRFQLINDEDGSFLEDVAIPNSLRGRKFLTAYRRKDEFALAVANPTDELVEVEIRLFDLKDLDIPVDGAFLFLRPNSRVALFLGEILTADIEEGHLIIETDSAGDFEVLPNFRTGG